MALESRSESTASSTLGAYLTRFSIELMPVTLEQAEAARVAWRRFGKGNHPPSPKQRENPSSSKATTFHKPI